MKRVLTFAMFGVIFLAGYALAKQTTKISPDPEAIGGQISKAGTGEELAWLAEQNQLGKVDDSAPDKDKQIEKIATQYVKDRKELRDWELAIFNRAAIDTRVPAQAVLEIFYKYHRDLRDAKSAVQASELSGEASMHLQAIQVVQNARIIDLLTRIASHQH